MRDIPVLYIFYYENTYSKKLIVKASFTSETTIINIACKLKINNCKLSFNPMSILKIIIISKTPQVK